MTVTEQALSRVSFAVRLRDDFTAEPYLVDKTRVFIKENGTTALENPCKYQVFTGVTAVNVTVRVENKYYFPQEVSVNLPGLDARNPVVTVTMKPNYLYPFPGGSTLVRGIILDGSNEPVAGARIAVAGAAVANESQNDGRFVLYWGPLTEDDISVVGNHRYLKISGGTTIQLNVNHPSYQPKSVTIGTMDEGELKLLTTPIILVP